MKTNDIDPAAPPEEKRCTSHLFKYRVARFCYSGSLQISDSPDFPPTILFDIVYAGVVLNHFGTTALKDGVAATWKGTFYPDGAVNAKHAEYKKIVDGRVADAGMKQNHDRDRGERYKTRGVPDVFDMLLTLPYIMVPHNELQVMLREAKEHAEAAEQRQVQEKVDAWIKQTTAI